MFLSAGVKPVLAKLKNNYRNVFYILLVAAPLAPKGSIFKVGAIEEK